MPVNVVAKNIKKLRNAKDISQEDLAKTLNVTRQAISSWENGKTQPDIDMLMAISNVLGVEMAELIYGEKPACEYDMFRKDRVKRAIILAAVLVILMLVGGSQSYIHEQRIRTFAGFWIILLIFVKAFVFPLIFGVAGATFLSVLSIWKDIRISNNKARKYFLIFGGAIILAYLICISLYLSNSQDDVLFKIFIWWTENIPIFIIPGVCFFLGLNGEKAELKKSIIAILAITLFVFVITALTIINAYT